jgi:hypothetical protein
MLLVTSASPKSEPNGSAAGVHIDEGKSIDITPQQTIYSIVRLAYDSVQIQSGIIIHQCRGPSCLETTKPPGNSCSKV